MFTIWRIFLRVRALFLLLLEERFQSPFLSIKRKFWFTKAYQLSLGGIGARIKIIDTFTNPNQNINKQYNARLLSLFVLTFHLTVFCGDLLSLTILLLYTLYDVVVELLEGMSGWKFVHSLSLMSFVLRPLNIGHWTPNVNQIKIKGSCSDFHIPTHSLNIAPGFSGCASSPIVFL